MNPHFRHGKAAGYRYIMGALRCAGLSKTKEHPTIAARRCPESNPRCRVTGAVSWPLAQPVRVLQWDQRDLNPGHHAQHGRAD